MNGFPASRSLSVPSDSIHGSFNFSRWDAKVNLIKCKYAHHPKLGNSIIELLSGCQKIASFVHEYDYDADNIGHGYRSFIHVIDKFLSLLINHKITDNTAYFYGVFWYGKEMDAHEVSVDQDILAFEKMAGIFVIVLSYMQKLRRSSVLSARAHCKPVELFCEEGKVNQEFFFDSINVQEEIIYFFGKFSNFWLHAQFRNVLKFYQFLVVLHWGSIFNMHKLAWSNSYMTDTFTNHFKNVEISFVSKIWGLSEMFVPKTLIPFLLYGYKPSLQKTMFIPTYRTWNIIPPEIDDANSLSSSDYH